MRPVVPALYGACLLLCAGLAVHYRHADELNKSARYASTFDSRVSHVHNISRQELSRLPSMPRRLIYQICFMEGGDTLGVENCYLHAASALRDAAREQRNRQWAALMGGVLCVLVGVGHFLIHRRAERLAKLFSQ